ncbi:M50 family metallopeptidase [Sphingomonas bacterium]|uniref:M50 family metallopeptidase n=1 Tax=Sphingomonas bacterium TaxID=1895847 RepID=UPI0015766C68|nr:M50 family metallopeptidase [Sphingomonas bacterium]
MTESPGFLLTIVAFALVIGPLVFVHEMGHYLVGRWFGIGADVFSIGFGREIAGWTDRRGTRWKLSALPLGGYVKFAGDMNPASQPSADWLALPAAQRQRTFQAKPVWQRALVVLAGPAVNFIVAILVIAGGVIAYGDVRTPPVVAAVNPGTAAARAGLLAGDRIVAIGGRSMGTFDDIFHYVMIHPRDAVRIDYVRDGTVRSAQARLGMLAEEDRFGNRFERGLLGVGPPPPVVVRVSPWRAPLVAAGRTWDYVRLTIDTLAQLVSGRRSIKDMSGPVGMARAAGEQITLGWTAFVSLIVLISINLGFINLLPIPMLDGGYLFFYAIEAVRRRPVTPAVQEWAFRGGLAALLALMFVVTANDLGKAGLWRGLGQGVGHGLAGLIG